MLGVEFGVSESAANYNFHQESNIFRELWPAYLLETVKKMIRNGKEFVKS